METRLAAVAHGSAAVALTVLVVAAGCSGPLLGPGETPEPTTDSTPTRTPTPTATPATTSPPTGTPPTPANGTPDVEVVGGNLSVDEDVIFLRVRTLVDSDVEPGTVTVRNLSSSKRGPVRSTPLYGMLGVGRVELNDSRAAGLTTVAGQVYFDPRGPRPMVERRLAHEFVHVVQFRSGMVSGPDAYPVAYTTDWVLTWRALVEGGAVYVTDAYVQRHMPGARRQSAVMAESYQRPLTPGNRVVFGAYYFGHRYVAARVESPRDLGRIYETLPRTTEQVIHNYSPDEEPPRPLTVEVETDETWTTLRDDRAGELYLRAVLRSELNRSRADVAATGWGTDDWRIFTTGNHLRWGLAWTFRWDTVADADEFESAAREYARRRRGETDAAFRVERVSPETVVLLVGNESFVGNATASGSDGNVTVSVGS